MGDMNERLRNHMLDELIDATEQLSDRVRLLERAIILHHNVSYRRLIGDKCHVCEELGLDLNYQMHLEFSPSDA